MTASEKPVAKPGVMEITPYVGGESELENADRIIRLAANESALGASPKAIEALSSFDLQRYPEGGSTDLRNALAQTFSLPADQLVVGAGSDELIALLVKAYAGAGDEVLYSEHGFLMYRLSALSAGATPVAAPESAMRTNVQAMLGHVTDRTRIMFVANPNNPTGSYLTRDELATLHTGLPKDVLLVIDAAYAEYATAEDYSAGEELVAAHDNVVMLRTFSKIFGLASLRVGWGYCSPAVADVLNRVRGPFNVSVPAQRAAVAALSDKEHWQKSVALNTEVIAWFKPELEALGWPVQPSLGNFLLADFGDHAEAMDEHLRANGIIVRRVAGYGLPTHLRIGIGTHEDMRAVLDAIQAFTK